MQLTIIKSVKACDAFPFSNKIIRESYCATAYTHLCFSSHLEAMIPFVFLSLFSLLRSFITQLCVFVLLSKHKAPCKLTQHCFQPTTLNIVGCYMLRPFANLVACYFVLLGVVASVYTPMSNNVESCCVCLHVAVIRLVFCKLLITVDNIKCFKNIFFEK